MARMRAHYNVQTRKTSSISLPHCSSASIRNRRDFDWPRNADSPDERAHLDENPNHTASPNIGLQPTAYSVRSAHASSGG